jgi:hypothetical protein
MGTHIHRQNSAALQTRLKSYPNETVIAILQLNEVTRYSAARSFQTPRYQL